MRWDAFRARRVGERVAIVALVAGCAGTGGPASSPPLPAATGDPSATFRASPPATASASPIPTDTAVAVPVVMPPDPAFAVEQGNSRGAFALRLDGPLAGAEVRGNATCAWNWDSGRPVADGMWANTSIAGEDVSIYSYDGLVLHRRSGDAERAPYGTGPAASLDRRQLEPRAWMVAFNDLRLDDTSAPEEDPLTPAFLLPLGGEDGPAALSGILAWRCDPPGEAPPTPYAPPEATCPGPPRMPEPPAVGAAIGDGPGVQGAMGSYGLTTCSLSTDVMAGELRPTDPLIASPGDRVTVSIEPGWRIVRQEGWDTPATADDATAWSPVDYPAGVRSFTIPVPARDGDSVLTLALTVVRDDGRVVGSGVYAFAVRVEP